MIIFDFDGTLADTISLGLSIINDYADHFKYSKIKREEHEDFSAIEVVQNIGIKMWKFPYLVWLLRKKIYERSAEIQIFPGVKEILDDLRNSGFKLGIITSNSEDNVTDFLKRNSLESYFSYVKTGVPTFGKRHALVKAKKQLKQDFVYVGDEIRDIEACRHAQIPVVSITWGLNSATSLEKMNPGMVAKDSTEALSLIHKTAEQYLRHNS